MEEVSMLDRVREAIEKPMELILKSGVSSNNLDYLYKLIDVYKDVENIEYWNAKEEHMRYKDYQRRPEDSIDTMFRNYRAYSENKEMNDRSVSSINKDSMMCLENMLISVVDFIKMLKTEASTQEEIDLIHKYLRKLNDM